MVDRLVVRRYVMMRSESDNVRVVPSGADTANSTPLIWQVNSGAQLVLASIAGVDKVAAAKPIGGRKSDRPFQSECYAALFIPILTHGSFRHGQ